MKTVRVRIAVAVNDKGEWSCYGCRHDEPEDDDDLAGWAMENLDSADTVVVHFIEADVPLPESLTIQGEVQP